MTNNDQEFLVQKIRTQYTEKQHTELDALKELDAKVKRPANVFAYTYGSVSAIVMGAGMSLVMTDIGSVVGLASAMVPGIAIGVVGMGMALTTYPIYKRILNSRKKKYAPEIMALSEKIMNGYAKIKSAACQSCTFL
jgi:orotate phosphoribosyltransferase-like protein